MRAQGQVAGPQNRRVPDANTPAVKLHGPGPHAGDWLRNTMQLPPQEQEKKLEQDSQFRQLPPERQQRLRDRLNHFNSLSPDQKQRVLNHMEVMEHLSPGQQKEAQDLFSQFRTLDRDRKRQMIQTLRQLRGMPPDARQRYLDSPELKGTHTSDELNLLRGLNDLGFVNNNRLTGQQ